MAHLAKWWKSKFLNGYKQFAAVVPTDCSDGRASDTEELLARQQETGCDQPPPPPPSQPPPLAFEEFECDVSVEGGVDVGGQERQEFSFTLYDFDGHGKITKDDIAGLVTTIYETLGSSIKVPHYGSKTIKVKLTVSPDQRPKAEETAPTPPTPGPPTRKIKRDLNVTIRESRRRPTTRRKRCEDSSSDNDDAGAADVSEDDDEPRIATDSGKTRPRRYQQHNSARLRQQNGTYTMEANVPPLLRHRNKKRSSSLQREELLQIIQANMEKNNLSFQTSRKQHDRNSLGEGRHSHHRHRHRVAHHEENFAARVQLHYLSPDPRTNCYLDLAGLEHSPYNKNCYDCKFPTYIHPRKQNYHPSCRSRGHHRSRSHDLSGAVRYQDESHHLCTEDPRFQHARPKSHEDMEHRHERKLPPVVMGHTSSPHHLKHRNREQDQARAMAQVVRWLEQEFSSSLNTAENLGKQPPNSQKAPNQTPESPKKDGVPTSPTSSSVERHEHHHVHEHIHHHYHHYQETPVLV